MASTDLSLLSLRDANDGASGSGFRTEPTRTLVDKEESSEETYAQSWLPDGPTQQAEIIHWLLKKARKKHRQRNFVACKDMCTTVLSEPHCTIYATVKALHLLSGIVSIEENFLYLQQVRHVIEGTSRTGDTDELRQLREKTTGLQTMYEKEKSGELVSPWPDSDEGQ